MRKCIFFCELAGKPKSTGLARFLRTGWQPSNIALAKFLRTRQYPGIIAIAFAKFFFYHSKLYLIF